MLNTTSLLQIVRIVTEESLRYLFGRFGPVVDAVICKSNIDRRQGRQSGYGFIHYPGNQQGVEASFVAADTLVDVMIDEVNYKCKISHHLEQNLRVPGSGPVAGVVSPTASSAGVMGMMQPGVPSALPPSMPAHHSALGMNPGMSQQPGLGTVANFYGPQGLGSNPQHQAPLAPSLPLYQRYGMNSPQVGAMSVPVAAPSLSTSNPTSPYGAYNIPPPVHHHQQQHHQQHHQSPVNNHHHAASQQVYNQQNYSAYGMTLPPRAPLSSFSHSNDAYQTAMDLYRGLYPGAEAPLGKDMYEDSNRMIKQQHQQAVPGGGQQQHMYQFQAQAPQQQLAPFAQPVPSPISPQSFYNTLSPPGYYQGNNNNSNMSMNNNYSNNNNRQIAAELPPTLSQPPHPPRDAPPRQDQGQVSGHFEQALQQSSSFKSVEFPSDKTMPIMSMPSIGSANSRSTEIMGAFEAMSLSASSGASALASYTSTENISQYPSLMIPRGPNTPNTSTHRMMSTSSTRKNAIDALCGSGRDMRRFDSTASMSQENVVAVKNVDEDLFTATIEEGNDNADHKDN